MKEIKDVAIYVRVSTEKQEAENQLIRLRNFCKKKDWVIYKEYVDVMSGKINSRPQFNAMFQDAHRLEFDIVLFWDLSRFSRSGTLYTLQKLQELDNLKIAWMSYKETFFQSAGPFKDVVLSIISTLAQMEREKISERTKAGLKRAKLQGKKLGRPQGSKDNKKRRRSCFKKE